METKKEKIIKEKDKMLNQKKDFIHVIVIREDTFDENGKIIIPASVNIDKKIIKSIKNNYPNITPKMLNKKSKIFKMFLRINSDDEFKKIGYGEFLQNA